tara:strand:+ start:2816 stop:4177 length:1362 start_codon:yes stop_codon:yes gene_type:complete
MVQKLKNNLDKKIFIKTFGCQMNEYDSNRIYDLAKSINYEKTNELDKANCYVLNTCHIREKATDKVYHEIGRVKKNFRGRKKPIIVVTGCVAQAEGDILLDREKYIDAVIGPQSFHKFNQIIKKIEKKSLQENFTSFDVKEKFDTLNYYKNSDGNVSSFLTIQEGCDKFCKFCVVPYTRGAEFSRPINELVKECKDLASNGVKEITLLGQNVNAYYHNEKKLSNLISEISEIKNIKRIRYTTSHPKDFTEDLIDVHRNNKKKLMPLIHLPVQSGSNKILKAMNRKHTVEDYLEIINKLREVSPNIKFSSDFIIGYPGETENDFNDTLNLLNKIQFINCYSFIFSPRPGTPAAKLTEIDYNIAKERLVIFQKIADQIKLKYRRNLFNKSALVLFENRVKNKDEFFGRDEYSNSVIVKTKENIEGKIKEVQIKGGNQNTLFGEIEKRFNKRNFAA